MSPRPLAHIAQDFAAGAENLASTAAEWQQGQFSTRDLTDADAVLRGMSQCLAELRAKGAQDESP